MKTLMLSLDFPPSIGGIQTYSYEIAKNLSKLGMEIIVLAPQMDGASEFDEQQRFKVIRINEINSRPLKSIPIVFYYSLLALISSKFEIERIHLTRWSPASLAMFFLSILFRIPYFITVHGLDILLPQEDLFLRKIMILTLRNARNIIAVSNYTRKKLIEARIPPRKIKVIPNGVDTSRFNLDVDSSNVIKKYHLRNRNVVLTVSRLIERKGHDLVIKSISEILCQMPNIVYLIVGTGDEEKRLRKIVNDFGLAEHVIFAGVVSDGDLPKYYSSCDVFVMPAREISEKGDVEGFGITYLEANACGKPVIGGRAGGVEDAIIDGTTGLLVDPLDIDGISYALLSLLTNRSLAKRLGKAGRSRVVREFKWEKITKETINVYIE